MQPKDLAIVLEGMHLHLLVMVVVEPERLSEQVLFKLAHWAPGQSSQWTYQAVQVVHALNVDEEAATMLIGTLNKRVIETTLQTVFVRDDSSSGYRRSASGKNRRTGTYHRLPKTPKQHRLRHFQPVGKCSPS